MSNLRAVVEVVPVGAGTDPVVVGSGVVGLVVGVRALEVQGRYFTMSCYSD